MFSLKTFLKDYNSIYKEAELIFSENNLCQWETDKNGMVTCIINRLNSKKNNSQFIETDGCCILICKNPNQYNDKFIKKKQHNSNKGCLIKNIKCKLHYCNYLAKSTDENINRAIEKINMLKKEFCSKYNILWKKIPYGLSKNIWIKYYKEIYKRNNRVIQ